MSKQYKFTLEEKDIPKQWYNIQADMPNPMLPPLHPGSKQPVGPEDLSTLFPMELIKQEVTRERNIPIPETVWEHYKMWRPTPLFRAHNFEKALDTPAKIYYKYEGVSPAGSHKLNTALPQVYYNVQEGVKKISTETGAGQWGSALTFAGLLLGAKIETYMVRISYDQKPYRKLLMEAWNGKVFPSPSNRTDAGRKILDQDAQSPGSLGIAISEAIEVAAKSEGAIKYSLGSVLNHVLLHQTVIGQEAMLQMEQAEDAADIIIAPLGGGSNFSGLAFPFLKDKISGKNKGLRAIAVEPASCPKLTKGQFRYDFGDSIGMTPLLPMFTLGHTFVPEAIHAGGLRYHGASALVSQLLRDQLIEAQAIHQLECFQAGIRFFQTEGILPAPEANHAIAQVIREAEQAKKENKAKVILFNLCGHGHLDMSAYQDYLDGKLQNHELSPSQLQADLQKLDQMNLPRVPN